MGSPPSTLCRGKGGIYSPAKILTSICFMLIINRDYLTPEICYTKEH